MESTCMVYKCFPANTNFKNSVFVLFLFLFTKSFSQQNKFAIVLSPSILTLGTFAVQPGVQYQFAPQWSVLAEMAIPLSSTDKQFEKISLLRNSLELKKL